MAISPMLALTNCHIVNKRATLTQEILIAMAAPQIALLAIALLLGRIGVNHGLKPLTDLAAQNPAHRESRILNAERALIVI